MMPLVKGKVIEIRDRYKVGRGNSIHDNVSGGEIWVINDEDPEKIDQGFETCAVLSTKLFRQFFTTKIRWLIKIRSNFLTN